MSAPDPSEEPRSEARLREALARAADSADGASVDLPAVLDASRRARRKRRSALVGGTLAVVGVLAVTGIAFGAVRFGTASSGASDAGAPEQVTAPPTSAGADSGSGVGIADPDAVAPRDEQVSPDLPLDPLATIVRCGAPFASGSGASGEAAPDASTAALVVTVAPPAVIAAGGSATVAVTVENASAATVEGGLAVPPVVAITDAAGVVVGRSAGATPGRASTFAEVHLAPGESVALSATIVAVRCAPDGGAESSAALPPLSAGGYGIGAAVEFVGPDDAAGVLRSEVGAVSVR